MLLFKKGKNKNLQNQNPIKKKKMKLKFISLIGHYQSTITVLDTVMPDTILNALNISKSYINIADSCFSRNGTL